MRMSIWLFLMATMAHFEIITTNDWLPVFFLCLCLAVCFVQDIKEIQR